MHKIIFSQEAKNNISDIEHFISIESTLWATKVLSSIKGMIDYLKVLPEIWRPIGNDVRQLVEPKYKYRIIYTFWEKDSIIILNIIKYQNIY